MSHRGLAEQSRRRHQGNLCGDPVSVSQRAGGQPAAMWPGGQIRKEELGIHFNIDHLLHGLVVALVHALCLQDALLLVKYCVLFLCLSSRNWQGHAVQCNAQSICIKCISPADLINICKLISNILLKSLFITRMLNLNISVNLQSVEDTSKGGHPEKSHKTADFFEKKRSVTILEEPILFIKYS